MGMEEYSLMGMYTKANGKTELLRVKEYILMKTELCMLEIGSMMNNMDREKKLGSTGPLIKESTNKDKKTGKEYLNGLTEAFTKEIFEITCQTGTELTFGLTEENISETGKIQRCMAKENIPGLTVDDMKVNTLKT